MQFGIEAMRCAGSREIFEREEDGGGVLIKLHFWGEFGGVPLTNKLNGMAQFVNFIAYTYPGLPPQ